MNYTTGIPQSLRSMRCINTTRRYWNEHDIKIIGKYNIAVTQANKPSVIAITADVPVANPSMPSVRLAPFDTAVTIKITIGTKTNHVKYCLIFSSIMPRQHN